MSIGSFDKSITSADEFDSAPRKISRVAGTLSDSVGIYFEPKITSRPIDRHLRSMTFSQVLLRQACSHSRIESAERHFRIML
jgi:hypothetical protein